MGIELLRFIIDNITFFDRDGDGMKKKQPPGTPIQMLETNQKLKHCL